MFKSMAERNRVLADLVAEDERLCNEFDRVSGLDGDPDYLWDLLQDIAGVRKEKDEVKKWVGRT